RACAHRRARRQPASVELPPRGTRVRRTGGARTGIQRPDRQTSRRRQMARSPIGRSWRRPSCRRRDPRRDVGRRGHRANRARSSRGPGATRRHWAPSSGRRDGGDQHARDRPTGRRGCAAEKGIARRALPGGFSPGEANLVGPTHRTLSGKTVRLDSADPRRHSRHSSEPGVLMSRTSLLLACSLLGVAACAPDSAPVRELAPGAPNAITFGTVDANNTYSNVGALVVQRVSDGQIFPICTGTLIAPTVFLTAGHCTAYAETLSPGAYVVGASFANLIAWGDLTPSHPKFAAATSVV